MTPASSGSQTLHPLGVWPIQRALSENSWITVDRLEYHLCASRKLWPHNNQWQQSGLWLQGIRKFSKRVFEKRIGCPPRAAGPTISSRLSGSAGASRSRGPPALEFFKHALRSLSISLQTPQPINWIHVATQPGSRYDPRQSDPVSLATRHVARLTDHPQSALRRV